MAQLYHQRQIPPGEWLLSGPETGSQIELRAAATIVYAAGGSDTLPAYTPAVLAGGTATFDRSTDVYVPYVVKGDPTLRLIKEADLPTLTDDYAPLARVELHAVKPYQPEPYLASGGLGNSTPTTVTVVSSTAARARSLWNGSSNDAPPATWQTTGYDDSAWAAAVAAWDPGGGPPAGTTAIWSTYTPVAVGEQILVRHNFALPAGAISAATLAYSADDATEAIYLNGTALSSSETAGAIFTLPVPPTALVAGGSNVLAVWARDHPPGGTLLADDAAWQAYALVVTYAGSGQVVAPGGTPVEGDLLYYHNGAWTNLPLGTSGQELTVVSGDPAWATPPAGYSDPLTTKGDLLTRSASAAVRFAVGSDGKVLTADSTQPDGLSWATAASAGVTSVALAGPTGTTVSGSPITSSGTLTLSWASQAANTMLAAPNGASGAPTFRALVAADIPSLPASQITSGQLASARGGTGLDGSSAANGTLLIGNGSGYTLATLTAGSGVTVTNGSGTVTIAASGGSGTVTSVALTVPGFLSVSGSPVTTSGTLAVTLATQSAGTVMAGPASGSAAAPTFRALQGSDLPPAAAAGGHIHAHGNFI